MFENNTVGVRVWKDRCRQDQPLQSMGCLYELVVFSSTTAYSGRTIQLKGIPWIGTVAGWGGITDHEVLCKGDPGAPGTGLRLTPWFEG